MEIHEPKVSKVTLKSQKQKNLGKFLIFDVFVQLWIFTLTTNIWDVNSNLSYSKKHSITIAIFSKKEKDIWLFL